MASKSGANVKVTFTGDTSDLDKKLAKLEAEVGQTSKEIDTITTSTGKSSEGLKNFSRNVNDAGDRLYGLSNAMTGTQNIMSGLSSGNFVQVGLGLVDIGQAVSTLATDFAEWGKKAWDAGKKVVEAHLASVVAKGQDIAAMVLHKIATIASTVATQAMAAAQWLLNAAMSANPIALVVIAIAALAAGFYLAYEKVGWFHDAVDKAWQILQGVLDWVRDHWKLILELLTGPIGIAVIEIVKHWDKIKDGFTGVKDWISTKIDDIVGFFTGLPARLATAGKDMFKWIEDSFRESLNWVIRGWNGIEFSLPSVDTHIPGVGHIGGWTLGTPDIPLLHNGGVFRSGRGEGLALLQDGETVIPRGGGGGGSTFIFEMNGREFARAIVDESNDSGGLPIRIRAAS